MHTTPSSNGRDFGVYIHWPFCAAKCPYCDFNSHVRPNGIDQDRFANALIVELETLRAKFGDRKISTIFFGGGTPSLMKPAIVGRIIETLARLWSLENDVEITLEANPASTDAKNFAGYRDAGVNRLSIGVQSLIDADLKALGRLHSAQEALAAVHMAARRFDRVSIDLIYARPGQSAADWRAELGRVLDLPVEHLSLYQLTIEPQTPFAALHRAGRLIVPEEDVARELFDITGDMCQAAGYDQYEISNYARPGAQSRHNLLYWRYHDFAGAGPGAHSRIAKGGVIWALETVKMPEIWAEKVALDGHGIVTETALSPAQVGDEMLLMGLRLSRGIDLAAFAKITGRRPSHETLARLEADGLIKYLDENVVATTNQGRAVLDWVIARIASSQA